MPAPVEGGNLPDWPRLADRWRICLPGPGLGYSHFDHHGVLHLPDGGLVDARHGGTALARLASDDLPDLVVR